jgi:hypothetical protein
MRPSSRLRRVTGVCVEVLGKPRTNPDRDFNVEPPECEAGVRQSAGQVLILWLRFDGRPLTAAAW